MENLSRLQTASWRTVKIPIFSQGDVYQTTFPNSINWCMSVETTRPLNHIKHKCSYIIKKWTYHTHTHSFSSLTLSCMSLVPEWMQLIWLGGEGTSDQCGHLPGGHHSRCSGFHSWRPGTSRDPCTSSENQWRGLRDWEQVSSCYLLSL